MPKSRRRKQTKISNVALGPNIPVVEESIAAPVNGELVLVEPAPRVTERVVAPNGNAPTLRSLTHAVTLESAAYVILFIVALLLRVVNLDAHPLAPAEAQTAAAAWAFLNGSSVGAYTSPLLFTLDWVSFLLFGAFDLTARMIPAILGTGIVLVPLLARSALGKTGAFIAALLLAFSPAAIFFARTLTGADLAVGAALGALVIFYGYRQSGDTRWLRWGAALAAIAFTADATAFTILGAGGIFLAILWAMNQRTTSERERKENAAEENSALAALQKPFVRAALVFAAMYVLIATTFLLNRDGLGIAFNLFGEWLNAFSSVGDFVSPLNWLVVYEPLALIFGLAALALFVSTRGESSAAIGLLRLVGFTAVTAFVFYTFAGNKTPAVVIAVTIPLALLAGWFVGNMLERARDDIAATGGTSSMLSGEIPVFVMLMVLAALVYLQSVTFLQQTQFSPALNALYQVLTGNTAEPSLPAAAITLAMVSLLLLGVFIGLSVLLVGVARTTTLLAFAILILLALGMLRATWLLNFSTQEPLRELLAPAQTPLQARDLVHDLEFVSQARARDSHILRVVADPQLGAVAQWYLRVFPNISWSNQPAALQNAEAIVTPATTPPPGNWMGQRYHVRVNWEPGNLDGLALWRWYILRQGGSDTWQTTMVWLPTEQQ